MKDKLKNQIPLCELRLRNGASMVEEAYSLWCYTEAPEDFDEYHALKKAVERDEENERQIAASFINMTPHDITILNDHGQVERIIPSSGLVRLKAETVQDTEIHGIKVSKTVFGEPQGLPDYQEGTFYIVSQLVKSALPERADLLVPAEVVRDEAGTIVGCKSLGR